MGELNVYVDYVSDVKKRIQWIDICKGIAIILVIIGHVKTVPWIIRSFIFSFHMPLFFVVNGFLIRDYNIKHNLNKSLRSLLKPYFIVCMMQALLAAFFCDSIENAGSVFFDLLNDMVIGISRTSTLFLRYRSVWLVWFVGCLFITRNLYVIIRNVGDKYHKVVFFIIIPLISFFGVYIGEKIGYLPWSIDVAFASLVFVAFGNILRVYPLQNKTEIAGTIVAFVIWITTVLNGCGLELATRRYPHGIFCYVCALSGCIVAIRLCKVIENIPIISTISAWAGRNSMIILAVHCLEMRFFKWEEWIYVPLGIRFNWMIECVLHTLFILSAVYIFVFLKKQIDRYRDSSIAAKNTLEFNGRLCWPDIAKGICIISIILGHLGITWINRIVYVYHLPVFYLIAGYFFKQRDPNEFIVIKAKRLLIPYSVTSVIICLLAVMQAWLSGSSRRAAVVLWTGAALYGAGDNWSEPIAIKGIGAIWFLLALFLALQIINYFAEKKYWHVIIVIIAFVGWASFEKTGIWLPLSIQAGMVASLYVMIGYEIRKCGYMSEKENSYSMFILFLITAFAIQTFAGFWLVHNYFGHGWLDFFTSIAAGCFTIRISQKIKGESYLGRGLSFLGRNSLIILCAHIIELNVLPVKNIAVELSERLMLNSNHSMIVLIIIKMFYVTIAVIVVNYVIKHLKTAVVYMKCQK